MLISIVDDDPWAREGVRDLIESLGYSASMFASAEEFLESGFITETTCLITDLQMQGLNGLDLQRRLLDQGHHIPTIFITAYPDEARRKHALDAGAIGFLSKPLNEQSLIDCLALAVNLDHKNSGPGSAYAPSNRKH